MKKTCIKYRAASNFKAWNTCVINGVLSEEQKDIIMSCLADGEDFIPSMVGLPEVKFGAENEDDQPFFELTRDGFHEVETPDALDTQVDITPEELVEAFQKNKARWWQYITVTEWCSECETEITMEWNVDKMGYKAFCPVCGGSCSATCASIAVRTGLM